MDIPDDHDRQGLLPSAGPSHVVNGSADPEPHHDFRPVVFPPRKKRPGPKRDSKPAPSEKLERNRQAQRTHRERKEQYTKDLELEVMRLKDLYVQLARERDEAVLQRDQIMREHRLALEEIQRLRERVPSSTLASADSAYDDTTRASSFAASIAPDITHAISPDALRMVDGSVVSPWHVGPTESIEGPTPATGSLRPTDHPTNPPQLTTAGFLPVGTLADQPVSPLDYDDIGLDFVLTLERPCMQHQHYLTVRAHNPDGPLTEHGAPLARPSDVPDDGQNEDISGHALMATTPTLAHVMDRPGRTSPHLLPDLTRPDLIRLLNMSQNLPHVSEQELPPVRAWLRILQEEATKQFTRHDFDVLKADLIEKVECLRFGAVLNEAHILQAVKNLTDRKMGETSHLVPDGPVLP